MTMARFPFQRECVAEALAKSTGVVLNVGSYNDPGRLRQVFGSRVLNCDISDHFPHRGENGHCYDLEHQYDCRQPWPFEDGEAEMVVLGDILEHLTWAEMRVCLTEARRVSRGLCITVPRDSRRPEDGQHDQFHITVVDAQNLQRVLAETGWHVREWRTVNYSFVPEGYFVKCS